MVAGLHRKFFSKLPFEIEEVILLLIIILNFFDAIEMLPASLDYIKKIISWSALGILLYRAKISKLLTGVNRPKLDGILIGGYFLLIIKDLVAYAVGSVQTTSVFLQPFYYFLARNGTIIEQTGLLIGLCLLVFVAFHFTFRAKIKKPSVLAILNEDNNNVLTGSRAIKRFIKSLFVIFMFFVVVFNLVMEWLAIAIDAPLLMIGLAIYIFFIVRHKKRFLPKSFLAKFGNFGGQFYEDVIEHFKYKKTILRALSGLLVLHLLTDTLNFVWPFILGIADPLYFSLLSTAHPSVLALLHGDVIHLTILQKIVDGSIYFANTIGLLVLLLLPGFFWILLYKNKPFTLKKQSLAFLLGTFVIMLLNPVFRIKPLFGEALFGIDIIAHSALQTNVFQQTTILIIGISIGVITLLLTKKVWIEKKLTQIVMLIVQFFFTAYTIMFFVSVSSYYTHTILFVTKEGKIILGLMLLILFVCTIIFYLLSLLSFLTDTHQYAQKHLRYKTLRTKERL